MPRLELLRDVSLEAVGPSGLPYGALDDLQKDAVQTIYPGADRREVVGRRWLALVRPFQCTTQKPCAGHGIPQKLVRAMRAYGVFSEDRDLLGRLKA